MRARPSSCSAEILQVPRHISATPRTSVLQGDADANVMIGGQGNDVLQGAGGADVLRGGSGDDELVVGDLSFARAAGGNGIDTLRLDASGVTLDLTLVADNRVTDIEAIDIRGGGANTLTLDLNEALNLSTHSNTVIVHRDVDDQVDIGTGWADVGTETHLRKFIPSVYPRGSDGEGARGHGYRTHQSHGAA